IRQARMVNDSQPAHAVRLIVTALGGLRGRTIAALGLAYKPDVDDLRESPAIEVARLLAEGGARVASFEPFALAARVPGCTPADSLDAALRQAEAVVLLVDHRAFVDLDPVSVAKAMTGRVAIDTRGRWDRRRWTAAGFEVHVLGAGKRDG
ncbi:MAG: UDP-N-acetyl-D-mannosamine dehydrogenase, partial [Anaerolineales bacterium]|nr:UDP-N-acetyl-D-mannosamine dehydrogenase [Anaerolineales bacterium]